MQYWIIFILGNISHLHIFTARMWYITYGSLPIEEPDNRYFKLAATVNWHIKSKSRYDRRPVGQ
jgi:hypothetical protein